jgi:hypothetical protein
MLLPCTVSQRRQEGIVSLHVALLIVCRSTRLPPLLLLLGVPVCAVTAVAV